MLSSFGKLIKRPKSEKDAPMTPLALNRVEDLEEKGTFNKDEVEDIKTFIADNSTISFVVKNCIPYAASSSSVSLCWDTPVNNSDITTQPPTENANEDIPTSGSTNNALDAPMRLVSEDKIHYKYEYQVRYFRTGYRTDGWKYSAVTSDTRTTIPDLLEGTSYTFSVQVRTVNLSLPAINATMVVSEDEDLPKKETEESKALQTEPRNQVEINKILPEIDKETKEDFSNGGSEKVKRNDAKWSADSEYVVVKTWTQEKEDRIKNFDRVTAFLYSALEDYEEPEHVIDTYLDKASRGFDGLLEVASFVGFGGKYLSIAKNIWKVRGIGLTALIFRQELQGIVVALGSQIGTLGKNLGLTSKEVIIGIYYHFWDSKKERILKPDIEVCNHALGKPGVVIEDASVEMINDWVRIFMFARLAYKTHPAKVQWILKKLTQPRENNAECANEKRFGDEQASLKHDIDEFKLVCFRGYSRHNKPAFCVFSNKNSKVCIISIRGTKSLEDMLTNHSFGTVEISFNSLKESLKGRHAQGDTSVEDGVDETSGMSLRALRNFSDDGGSKQLEYASEPTISSNKFLVHSGMYSAARWLVRGNCSISSINFSSSDKNTAFEVDSEEGGGINMIASCFHSNGYKIILTGHSMGAAVATLVGLLLIDQIEDLKLTMYGYASPPCTDYTIAMKTQASFYERYNIEPRCKEQAAVDKFLSRMDVRNFVSRDDMVPRMSLHCLQACALEIKRTKDNWGKYVEEDRKSFTERAKSFWAPNQRSKLVRFTPEEPVSDTVKDLKEGLATRSEGVNNIVTSLAVGALMGTSPPKDSDQSVEEDESGDNQNSGKKSKLHDPTKEEKMKFEVNHDLQTRLFVPGVILHSFRYHGIDKAAIVAGDHNDFSKIQAFENMKSDHECDSIALNFRSIISAKNASRKPPAWQPVNQENNTCNVCNYFVGWNSTIGGKSGAVEVRSTFHCNSCGKVVCAHCSNNKRPIPEIGIIRQCRICDICEYKYSSSSEDYSFS